MAVQKFPPSVTEKLGYYVYALKEPAIQTDKAVFYVGKGTGNRAFSHAHAAAGSVADVPNARLDRIRAIRDQGRDVEIEILRHGLTEREALEIEAVLIEHLGLDELLTNLVEGHGKERGRMSANDVIALYEAKQAPPFPKSLNAILLRIPVLWFPAMPANELYEATRRWWVVGPRRDLAECAFAVNRGVIREVYKIDEWWRAQPGEAEPEHVDKRWGFRGTPDNRVGDTFRNTDVSRLFRPGAANPVRYVNC